MTTVDFNTPSFIDQIRCKQHEAVTVLVKGFTKDLFKGALSMGFQKNDAEELVQSTWDVFFKVCHKFEGRSKLQSYLFGILYNKAREKRKELFELTQTDPIDLVVESRFDADGEFIRSPVSPDRMVQSLEVMQFIHGCLDGLPVTQRAAFCLKEIDGLPTEEICNILNLSPTHLGVLLFRARNGLRECLEAKLGEG